MRLGSNRWGLRVALSPIRGPAGAPLATAIAGAIRSPANEIARIQEIERAGPIYGPRRVPDADKPQTPATPASATQLAAQDAAARQDGLGPLIADLRQALGGKPLPPAARAAAAQVMMQLAPMGPEVEARDVMKALSNSGLLLEAKIAAEPQASPIGVDLKAALLVLRQALTQGLPRDSVRTPGKPTAQRPPPPYRGGPTTPQRPAASSLSHDAEIPAVLRQLADETDAAIARTELLQIASLPSPHDLSEAGEVTRWVFEAPVATQQGAAMVQFEIRREGRGTGRDREEGAIWRTRFSLDIPPVGPVEAHLTLAHGHLGVALWAQSADGAERLRTRAESLNASLAAASLPADVAVYHGTPAAPSPTAGKLVDQVL